MATQMKPRPAQRGSWLPLAFKGVRDTGDARQQDPSYLQDAINAWFQDPENGGDVVARPGFQKTTTSVLHSGDPLTGTPVVSFFGYQHTDGTNYVFAFTLGKLWRQGGAAAWTDVTPVGITFASSIIHAIIYNGEMIVADGAGKPWRGTDLTATPITGTVINIDSSASAWVSRGAPTVHGGKLFFIVQSVTSTTYTARIVWSEELSAATGYLQSGFTNSWDLIQSSVPAERILAIQGTNNGLYYWRTTSIGVIHGSVNADFSTASTHDGVSNGVGLAANFDGGILPAVLLAKDYIWFVDNSGRPVRLRVGSTTIKPIWQQMKRRLRAVQQLDSDSDDIRFSNWHFAYSPDLNKVVAVHYPRQADSTSVATSLSVFDADSGSYEGRWRIGITSQPANETDGILVKKIHAVARHGSISFPTMEAAGEVTFIVGTNTGDVYHQTSLRMVGGSSVAFGDDGMAMHMSLTTHLEPAGTVSESRVDELHVEAFPDSGTMSLDYYTPGNSKTGLTATGITGADSIQSSHDHGVYRYGLAAVGRWFRAVLHWNVPAGSTPYGFERALLKTRGYKATGVTK